MIREMEANFPIDAVITWVDGNDEHHREKMLPYVEDKNSVSNKNFRTRFDQVNEIKYTIDSILKFAPFMERIFVVTDQQVPDFLVNKEPKYKNVFIVDHSEIFQNYQELMPVFNCRPIETLLYRIPGLSEHFVYFNDDMILMNPTKPSDYFVDEVPVLRGSWQRFDENRLRKRIKEKIKNTKRAGHKLAQQKGAKLLGFKKYYKFEHTPYPLRKSTFENYFQENKNVEYLNIKHKFRNMDQFTPQGLANHIEIKNGTCVLKKDIQLVYIGSYKKPIEWYKLKLNKFKSKKDLLFLNVQSLDQCSDRKLKVILGIIDDKLKAK